MIVFCGKQHLFTYKNITDSKQFSLKKEMPRRFSLTNLFNSSKSKTIYRKLNTNDDNDEDLLKQFPKCLSNNFCEMIDEISHCSIQRMICENPKEHFEIVFSIDDAFTNQQKLIIEKSLQILVNRLFENEILENMYSICQTSSSLISDSIWQKSNLDENLFYNEKYLLLEYQLMCLKMASENGEFPIINIRPIDENQVDNSGCISCVHHQSTFIIDGDFQISIDPNQLIGSHKDQENILYWSGIIVFQMLHNLGHRFDQIHSQIDAFTNSFLNRGRYTPC